MIELKTYEKWLDKAKDDLLWARVSLDEEVFYGACFAAQQAAEKALKAYLIARDSNPRRIHDLTALLEDCILLDEKCSALKEACAVLTDYYVEVRYPDIGDFTEYTQDQATEAFNYASKIIEFIESEI